MDSCYQYVLISNTRHTAASHCQQLGGQLAFIITPEEQNFIQGWIGLANNDVWLGGREINTNWMWTEGNMKYFCHTDHRDSCVSNQAIYS